MQQHGPESLGIRREDQLFPVCRRVALAASGAAVALWLCQPLWSQTTNQPARDGLLIKNFVLAEHYEAPGARPGQTNLLKALVIGKTAVPYGHDLYLVREMRMEQFLQDGRTNLVARSPECIVDLNRKEISSSQHVKADGNGGNLFIEGDGFFCRLTNLYLVISNNVRTVIRQ